MRAPVIGDIIGESPEKANSSMFSPSAYELARITANIRHVLIVAVVSLALITVGCVTEDDLTADQRVYQLSQQLMCPVCDGQTLDQSQAQLSEDMKAVIQTKIEDGETNAEIRAYFVERYGEIVLASPDAGGFNLIVWVVPGLIFIAGALLVGNAYLNMRRRIRLAGVSDAPREAERPRTSTVEADLDEYLQRADREMASALREGSSNPDAEPASEVKD